MFNLRYHVASLAAVFLALAVGLLLGTAIADRSTLDAGQQRLIQSVQDEFARLEQSNKTLARQLDAVRGLESAAAKQFTTGSLSSGRILLVVEGAGLPAGAKDLVASIKDAGGHVQVMAIRRAGYGLDDPQTLTAVASALQATAQDTATIAAAIESSLPAELISPAAGPVLKALLDNGAVTLDPGSPVAPSGVVFYYGGGDPTVPDMLPLAQRFTDLRVRVVGVERSDTEQSAVPTFADAQITTVDDVDQPLGQLSTVLALADKNVEGQFGSKPTATAPMPPLPGNGR